MKLRERDWGRGAANTVTILVGAVAGYLSWRHLNHLGQVKGLDMVSAGLTAAPIDGMIVVGTLQLRAARKGGRPAHWSAYLCVIVGVAATIGGNIAAAPANLWARILFATPPLAFLLSIEALFGKPLTRNLWELIRDRWSHKKGVRDGLGQGREGDAEADVGPDREVDAGQREESAAAERQEVVAADTGVNLTPVRKPHASSAERVVRAHQRTPDASHAELATRLKLSPATVKRYRPAGQRPEQANGKVPAGVDV